MEVEMIIRVRRFSSVRDYRRQVLPLAVLFYLLVVFLIVGYAASLSPDLDWRGWAIVAALLVSIAVMLAGSFVREDSRVQEREAMERGR
jgi:peptidoglycan/LPS O-acetylase OafA/YrhL